MRPWFYLFAASCLEVCWIYSLKFMDMKQVKQIPWRELFNQPQTWTPILPVLGYVVFGIGNIILLAMAMKYIPASNAFAVWMAMALIWTKLVDTLVLKEPFNFYNILFMILVLVGIIGLKATS